MGLGNHLKNIASKLILKSKSAEGEQINTSINYLISLIQSEFEDEVKEIQIFGSFPRGTMLPRKFDNFSDVDLMILFNTDNYEKLQPESYRNQLRKFADKFYPNSLVEKDFPSIVIEMVHTKIDLVPAVMKSGWILGERCFIPDSNNGWLKTNPGEFNEKIRETNKKYTSKVKPVIRLLKRWNSCQNKPFSSYDLENQISDMDFEGDNLESAFLYAVGQLEGDNLALKEIKKLDILKKKTGKIEWLLELKVF
jgi:predicted nucleotidyltransferase